MTPLFGAAVFLGEGDLRFFFDDAW